VTLDEYMLKYWFAHQGLKASYCEQGTCDIDWGCDVNGHVVWHIRNFTFLLLVTFFTVFYFWHIRIFTFLLLVTFCHHRILILFGFDVLMF